MNKWRAHLATWLVVGIVITAPINLFYKFAVSSGYVQGLLVDYLLPKIFISDILIGIFLILSLIQFGKTWAQHFKKTQFGLVGMLSVIFVAALIIRQIWSPYPLASFWYVIKLLELIALGIAIVNWRPLINFKYIWLALLASLCLQNIVSLYQFWTQKPLAPYWLLGETRIDSYIGIAQASFNGVLKTIPYGTSAHPNVLAGTIALHLWLTWIMRPVSKKVHHLIWFSVLIPSLVVLYLTQSVSAWLALALSFGLLFVRQYSSGLRPIHAKILFAVGLVTLPIGILLLMHWFPNNTSISRRNYLNQTALIEFSKQPLWGTGLNTMAAINEKYVAAGEITRFAQPTHHLGLLWLAETGLIGVALVGIFLVKFHRHLNWWLLAGWVPIMALDHYFLTINGGMMLFMFLLQFCWPSQQVKDSVMAKDLG